MKEIRKIFMMLFILLCLTIGLLWLKTQKTEGLRFVEGMGAGINIGNSLDVRGLKAKWPDASVQEYEVYWKNPPITAELLHSVKELGFGTVRIPVCWGEHLDADGLIDPAWMSRVEEVVNMAMGEGLYVVLDLHHEDWLIPTEEEEEQVTKKLCSLWAQIADTFQNHGDMLLFESMNEIRLVGSPYEWSAGTEGMREVVNRLNVAFVDTIRAAGGENKNRYLILPGYAHRSEPAALNAIQLPKDRRLIVSVHAYLPYSFTLQDPGTYQWSIRREKDTRSIRELMSTLKELFIDDGIPVLITEFGCADKNNPAQRQAWASYYTYQARKNGIGFIWWDQGGDMKLFDRDTGVCTQPELVEILNSSF